ncbi:MAG: hypothetical protein O2877_02005 [bacterium]|nr:hypothetical protein [bacterium]
MDQRLSQLISVYRGAAAKEQEPVPRETIVVNELVRRAASVYEIVRNTLEYSEAHLLRRNAIRRILRRRLAGEMEVERVAVELLQELIWARYLPNKTISILKQEEVAEILKKYVPLFEAAERDPEHKRYTLWLLDLVSTEIEYMLVPPRREEALVSLAYGIIKQSVKWEKKSKVKEDDKDIQLFVGVHRTLLKSNTATLRYRIFSLFYPNWSKGESGLVNEISTNLSVVHDAVERHLFHPVGETLSRRLRPRMVLFKILHDLVKENPDGFAALVADPKKFEEAVAMTANKRYKSFRSRLGRLVLRAVLFLFLTKLVLALAIELPYEILILKEENFIPLLANIFFHPLLLAALGLTGSIPEKKNTELLIEGVRGAVYGQGVEMTVTVKKLWAQGTIGFMFNILYAFTFVLSYGLITALLLAIHFNILSIILFLFFLSLVMFLGISIRRQRCELVIVAGKGGILLSIGDFFTLPIIRAGRYISMKAPRINVFLFFLDFIVEAPFKMGIQIIEGWLAFIKEKKDEME